MLYTCAARFDVTKNLKKFAKFSGNSEKNGTRSSAVRSDCSLQSGASHNSLKSNGNWWQGNTISCRFADRKIDFLFFSVSHWHFCVGFEPIGKVCAEHIYWTGNYNLINSWCWTPPYAFLFCTELTLGSGKIGIIWASWEDGGKERLHTSRQWTVRLFQWRGRQRDSTTCMYRENIDRNRW